MRLKHKLNMVILKPLYERQILTSEMSETEVWDRSSL